MSTTIQPALPPPAGLKSNFVDPPTLMPGVITGATFIITIITLFVFIRLFTKVYIRREIHTEDYLSLLAWAGVVTYTGIFLHVSASGFARHQWDVPAKDLPRMIYFLNVLYILYSPTTAAAKLSVFFQLKRIFTSPNKDLVYWMIQVSIVLNSIFYLGLFFSYTFQCWPREAIWNPEVKGKCISGTEIDFASGILNLISDVAALALPAWAIWHFKMPIRKKISIYAVFGVGAFAIIIGIVGIVYRVLLLRTADFTWVCTKAAMLVISEMAVVAIVGCMPMIARFYRFIQEKTGHSRNTNGPTYEERNSTGRNSKRAAMGTLGLTSVAKYTGPNSAANTSSSDEHLELYTYDAYPKFDEEMGTSPPGRQTPIAAAANGKDPGPGNILKTTCLQQTTEVVRGEKKNGLSQPHWVER